MQPLTAPVYEEVEHRSAESLPDDMRVGYVYTVRHIVTGLVVYAAYMRSKHKITTFVPDILLLEHWNRRFESFPTMYRSGGCLWLAGYANRM